MSTDELRRLPFPLCFYSREIEQEDNDMQIMAAAPGGSGTSATCGMMAGRRLQNKHVYC